MAQFFERMIVCSACIPKLLEVIAPDHRVNVIQIGSLRNIIRWGTLSLARCSLCICFWLVRTNGSSSASDGDEEAR